ncbi:MAG TPA: T3SS effector HopA1 family protein [Pilimelia sp.]|nr:T3SS effector HopA1 family protein [Pilimelia sp.]
MNRYRQAYRRICAEIEIADAETFRHRTLGRLQLTREIDAEPGAPVLSHLWRFLYLYYYAADLAAATVLINGSRTVVGIADREDPDFVARLSAAHPSRWYTEPGWRVTVEPADAVAGEFVVHRNGLSLTVTPQEVAGTDTPPRLGDTVSVRFPPERRYSNPGWYVAIGEAGLRRPGAPVVRLYYALSAADAAPQFLAAVASLLNERAVPFHLKVANHPDGFDRNDPVVVYLARPDWDAHRGALERLHAGFRARLRDAGPCFAYRLDRGWSMAAEPTGAGARGVSFGQHRCMLVAEGLLRGWSAGAPTVAERERAILERLVEAGLDPDRPYLNPEPAADPESAVLAGSR